MVVSGSCRYEDLVAQGVELHQASMPSSSSFSNISSDIAPGTPQRSPTQAPSPTHLGPQAAPNEHTFAAQQRAQPPPTDSARHQLAAESSQAESDAPKMNPKQTQTAEGSIQPALTHLDLANSEMTDSWSEPQALPLLANSASTLLSDKLANPALLPSQDMMLRSHQHEQFEAETVGLSQGAVQTGFRAAGKVSMAEGMSEPVTEAIEALGPVRKNFHEDDEVDGRTDAKGRLMKVCLHPALYAAMHRMLHALQDGFLQMQLSRGEVPPSHAQSSVRTHRACSWVCLLPVAMWSLL